MRTRALGLVGAMLLLQGCLVAANPPVIDSVSAPASVGPSNGAYTFSVTVDYHDDSEAVTAYDFVCQGASVSLVSSSPTSMIFQVTLPSSVSGTLGYTVDLVSASGLVSNQYTGSVVLAVPPVISLVTLPASVSANPDGSYTVPLTVTYNDSYEQVVAYDFISTSAGISLRDQALPTPGYSGAVNITVLLPTGTATGALDFYVDVISASGIVSAGYSDSVTLY
jgi:hypothetical protein